MSKLPLAHHTNSEGKQ